MVPGFLKAMTRVRSGSIDENEYRSLSEPGSAQKETKPRLSKAATAREEEKEQVQVQLQGMTDALAFTQKVRTLNPCQRQCLSTQTRVRANLHASTLTHTRQSPPTCGKAQPTRVRAYPRSPLAGTSTSPTARIAFPWQCASLAGTPQDAAVAPAARVEGIVGETPSSKLQPNSAVVDEPSLPPSLSLPSRSCCGGKYGRGRRTGSGLKRSARASRRYTSRVLARSTFPSAPTSHQRLVLHDVQRLLANKDTHRPRVLR